ncbi:ribonuclease J [Thermotomaculum hydrothermale]|uniref:Ribonuclease J n=1 Tax=Thermotomaculum hydrothermale TaxID=981385 RepID=A0A7R6PG91_9BACT|nr:ribonuclease J [Thermotomaculum hydrothermale]BBB33184.1 ribonuclease J [Thermotomaculum hydrothermale]
MEILPYKKNTVQIVPIGGLGEFGMNSMFLRVNDAGIVIDAGAMFPDFDQPGIDVVIPDYSFLDEHGIKDVIKAIVITHAHEDHIGAIPFLCQDIGRDIDIYGTKLTIGFIKKKLEEHRFEHKVNLHIVNAGESVRFNEIKVNFIQVTHSIVDSLALFIETPFGNVFHTGDFKIDKTPIDNRHFDFAGFARAGEKGVDLLMADSTNVERKGYTLSEKVVGESLEKIISQSVSKVIIACFSSHIHRVQQVLNVARKLNRKVALVGTSLVNAFNVAKGLGYLRIPPDVLINDRDIPDIPPHRLIIITTGSQGEPMSALSRIVRNEHKRIKVEEGDTVIISAKTIPGNEKPVLKIINTLYKKGAEVYYEEVSEVHVSGHASREELKMVFSMIKPKYFIPVHGEMKQLHHHMLLAREMGLHRRNIKIIEDGDVVELSKKGLRYVGKIQIGKKLIEGSGFDEVEEIALKDRRRMAEDGIIIVAMVVDGKTSELIGDVEIITRGFILLSDSENEAQINEMKEIVKERFYSLEDAMRVDWEYTRPHIRSALKKYIKKRFNAFPVILPIILTV